MKVKHQGGGHGMTRRVSPQIARVADGGAARRRGCTGHHDATAQHALHVARLQRPKPEEWMDKSGEKLPEQYTRRSSSFWTSPSLPSSSSMEFQYYLIVGIIVNKALMATHGFSFGPPCIAIMFSKTEFMNLLESGGFSRSNPYYVVQQGRIAPLTLMKDSGRLGLFKEIDGICVYDDRCQESFKLLKQTDHFGRRKIV